MEVSCSCRCSVLKVLVVLYTLLFLIFISEATPTYLYHECPNATAYNPNSTYQLNLNGLLSTLSNNVSNKLFYNATAGNSDPDRAFGLFMCRGDVTVDVCRDCVVTAAREIIQRCRKEKETYIWYDECMLRYNNKTFFSTADTEPSLYMRNAANATDRDRLKQLPGKVMDDLTARASSNQSANGVQMKGFATGETNFSSFQTLYSLVQCTPDLSGSDCNWCFRAAIGRLPVWRTGMQGGRVLLPSCNIRFETYPFYRITDSPTPTATLPPPDGLADPRSSMDSGGNYTYRSSSLDSGDAGRSAQISIGIFIGVAASIVVFCFLRRRRAKKYDSTQEATDGNEILIPESLQYALRTIDAATNNFSAENKIGKGGFGDVFKGVLPDGQEIAVKRLSKRSRQGALEFKNEVVLVAKLQHRNLVRLVGFCLEREEKLLIYEFVPNKSLDYFLFDPEKQQLLDWSRRYQIIGGIALGILYLHEHSRLRIVHRDLKASNVLLDKDMIPKISDFGMARLFGVNQSQANTNRIVGTFGYMAPEYVMHGKFSVKSDVFSFGVLLLEIISGKKNNSFYQSGGSENLLNHAWKCWKDGTPLDLVDPTLENTVNRNEVIRCIHISLLCVQKDPDKRPTMTSVLLMLNSYFVPLPLPHQPAFFVRSGVEVMLKQLEVDSKAMQWSPNEVSYSELYPR